ncbi:Gfo/Idh/MocA family oxidoreductase [Gimesia sp.]|uniref:Gfo/Idh/MocA family protein n=1 Tax=Gimesia sp. TaxID=2024833 RepID=UPI000C44A369|nr:Gfo/Idh/MocA family oxidoreductase [Gimesia sp.]MAX40374.1 oxidoreductase [Gimesia sp.]HAH47134.1 gfo/Idh/MocA family oxidoreductase [Planctomycetaceae bacterium]|tara:strand:+ start:2396 stop:3430 length:1035 start_codon:yes stop_codon:yes gene_type:complete
MEKRITVAVLTNETGAHLSAYFTALKEIKAVKNVVLSDPGQTQAEAARSQLGSKLTAVYDQPETLFQQEKPDLALVTMQARQAPQAINLALENGCHVFSEKPACLSVQQFEPLVQKAESKHLHLSLALANRMNPEILFARSLIQGGSLGKIYGVEMTLLADQTRLARPAYHKSWYAHKDQAGGGFLSWLGIHWIDLSMYLTESSITDVAGFTALVGGQPIDVEDSAAFSFRYAAGFLGTLTAGYYLKQGYQSMIKIWGSQGWLEMLPFEERHLEWTLNHNGKTLKFDKSTEPRGYTPAVEKAVSAVANDQDPLLTSRESLRIIRTIYACYEAAQTGKSQAIPQS